MADECKYLIRKDGKEYLKEIEKGLIIKDHPDAFLPDLITNSAMYGPIYADIFVCKFTNRDCFWHNRYTYSFTKLCPIYNIPKNVASKIKEGIKKRTISELETKVKELRKKT